MKMIAYTLHILVFLTQLFFARDRLVQINEYRRARDSQDIEWMQVKSNDPPTNAGALSRIGNAQWEEKNNGLYGAEGFSIAVNSQGHLFLGTDGGVLYRSLNSGDSWEVVNNSFSLRIETLAIDLNDNIYLENEGALQRSTDNGASFTAVGLFNLQVREIVAENSQILYAATDDGVYKSIDGGANWFAHSFAGSDVRTMAVSPDSTLLAATNTGIYKSIDEGATWNQLTNNLRDVTAIAFNSSEHIFVSTASNGVYRSTDGGVIWVQKIEGLPHDPFPLLFLADIVVDNSDNVFICTSFQLLYSELGEGHGGVYRSTDNGETWQKTDVVMTFVNALTTNSIGHIFAATRGFGAYRSTDNGASWTAVSTGLKNLTVNTIIANSNGEIFAATYGAGVYRSADNGETWTSAWTQITGSVAVGYLRTLTINSQGDLFAGANIAGMYRSTDGGQSWQHLDPFQVGLGGVGVNALVTNSQDHLFAGVNIMGLFGSKDNGNSWEHLLDTLIDVHMLALNSQDHIFAGSVAAGLFFSDDTGMTWSSVSIPSGAILNTIAFNAADQLFAGFRSQFPTVVGIYRQSQLGGPWEKVLGFFLPPPLVVGGIGIAVKANGIIVAGGSTGVAKSTSNGDSWMPYSDGLPNASSNFINADIYTVAFGPQNYLYAGIRNHGVYRSTTPVVSLTPSISAKIPTDFMLDQNYPNPFNPATTFHFALPERVHVELAVYNVNGQFITQLVDDIRQAGIYEVRWDASNLPSGIYFARLSTTAFTKTQKVTLLK